MSGIEWSECINIRWDAVGRAGHDVMGVNRTDEIERLFGTQGFSVHCMGGGNERGRGKCCAVT